MGLSADGPVIFVISGKTVGRVFIVIEPFSTAVSDFRAKKSARCKRALALTKLVRSKTHCILQNEA